MAKSKKKSKSKVTPKPKYPDYIEAFIQKVHSETPFIVRVDQYQNDKSYHVGVIKKSPRTRHCIWMVGYVDKPEYLSQFWTSNAFKSNQKD
jgi:hypothetical protein